MPLWWQQGIVYQIYPRSFQDSSGNGVGDLPGIIQRLDYLAWLGIEAIWISPVYPSPMADFGYDVSDYVDIHPLFGTLADMDALIEAGTIWAQGVEQFGKAYLALAQEAAEANSDAAKALFSVKSLKEAVDLQGEIARKNFDKSLNESMKLSELSVKVANEAFMPIQKQLTAAVAKAGKIAA